MLSPKTWEAVGPFPSGMREHPLTESPLAAFTDPTLDPDIAFAQRPYDEKDTWPSELGPGGRVGWKKFEVGPDGWLQVIYPEIRHRWDQLRSDHGWASLQYQSILRTPFHIPKVGGKDKCSIRIDLVQGIEFSLIPAKADPQASTADPIAWYAGDVYNFANTPTGTRGMHTLTSNFAHSLLLEPGEYVLLVRAAYEIRMFGDPGAGQAPAIRVRVLAEVDEEEGVALMGGLGVAPDAVDGWLMGEWASVGIRVPAGGEGVVVTEVESSLKGNLTVEIPRPVSILPGQTRPVTLRLVQTKQLASYLSSLHIRLKVKVGDDERVLTWHPIFTHHVLATPRSLPTLPIKITFASPPSPPLPTHITTPSQVSHAMVVPPRKASPRDTPVLLALHGAGVDATAPMWTDAMPHLPGAWAVLPTGKNEWGEDWHGGSMDDAWASREAADAAVKKIGVVLSADTLLFGHSNGGQGAWHLAARYPDRVVGAVIASGWLTIQHYVPYTESTSNHFADPALLGILHSALAPYSNDLHASNLSDIPILVVHGANDDNVPPRHSGAHAALISSWAGKQNSSVTVVEVPKRQHWWDDVLRSDEVLAFVASLPRKASWDEQRKVGYTLTTGNPQECGGRAGIRIVELDIPGRIARLDVNARQWRQDHPAFPLDLRGMNIRRIELVPRPGAEAQTIRRSPTGHFQPSAAVLGPLTPPRAYGPLIKLLSTRGPFSIVIPFNKGLSQHVSIAKRIAHDLYVYHRVDCEIMSDIEGLERTAKEQIGIGSVVVIGRPDENRYAEWMIAQKRIPVTFPTRGVMLVNNDKLVYDRGAGLIALHPHPTDAKSLACLIAGNDCLGLGLASRLFPIRTGVPVPDWAIVCPRSRWQAAAGLIGAGFWGAEWEYSEHMSWMDR